MASVHMTSQTSEQSSDCSPPVFLYPPKPQRHSGHNHRIIVDGQLVRAQQLQIIDNEELFLAESSGQDTRNGEIDVVQTTELGDSLKELNMDVIQKGTRMSGIDMRANLHYAEIASVLGVDTLVAFKFLPINALQFTRQKKRLSVSLDGRGRQQIVEIVAGKQAQDAAKSGGLFDKIRGLAGGGEPKQ